MVEALLALAIGAGLARAGVWPLQQFLSDRQERRDQVRAEQIVAEINRRAPDMPDVLV